MPSFVLQWSFSDSTIKKLGGCFYSTGTFVGRVIFLDKIVFDLQKTLIF